MSAMPPLPYSGNLPQASLSASSLRLQAELINRARSKSFATASSPTASSFSTAGHVIHAGSSSGSGEQRSGRNLSGPSESSYTNARSTDGPIPSQRNPPGPFSARPLMLSNVASTGDLPTLAAMQHAQTGSGSAGRPSLEDHAARPAVEDLTASFPPSTNSAHIWQELAASKDSGDTLDLSRKSIEVVDAGDVRILRSGVGRQQKGVWRLALSYNRLHELSFHDSFTLLGRLRYLNLKGNDLRALPAALAAMPSLEILDVSKNEIEQLPEDPGRLVRLRVLSLSNNKLRVLPGYLAYFANLRVLKVENNPIEWPPADVIQSRESAGGAGATTGPRPSTSSRNGSHGGSHGGSGDGGGLLKKGGDDEMRIWIATLKDYMRSHEQEQLRLKAVAVSEDESRAQLQQPAPQAPAPAPVPPAEVPSSPPMAQMITEPQLLGSTRRRRANTAKSSDQLHPVDAPPAASEVATLPPVTSTALASTAAAPPAHTRVSSFTLAQRMSRTLGSKKSLPDLRQPHADIIENRKSAEREPKGKDRKSHLYGLGIDASFAKPLDSKPAASNVAVKLDAKQVKEQQQHSSSPSSPTRSSDAYFRRLAARNTPVEVSPAMMHLMDGIRGILFALASLQSTVNQYASMIGEEARKALGLLPSSLLDALIASLDRIDAMARRRQPTTQLIRQLILDCRMCISQFGQLVQNVQDNIAHAADVRFSRLLLLTMYGSMAEVATAWKTLHPLLSEVKHLLATRGHVANASITSASSSSLRTPISPINETREVAAAEVASIRSSPGRHLPVLREKSKRNAGSFSAEDVATGMMLGPHEMEPTSALSDQSQATPLRPAFPHSRQPSSLGAIVIPEVDEDDDDDEGDATQTAAIAPSLLETLQEASELAYTAWLRLTEEMMPPTTPRHSRTRTAQQLMETVAKAEGTTRRLTENLMEVNSGAINNTLLDNVEQFTTAVWTVNELVNAISKERVLPPSVRALLASLVNKTRELDAASSNYAPLPPPSLRPGRPSSPAFGYRALEVKAPPVLPNSSSFASFQMPLSAGVRQGMPPRSQSAAVLPNSATTGRFGSAPWESRETRF